MNNISNYIDSFFSLGNPLLFGFLLAVVVSIVGWFFFSKIIFPLQKKNFIESQKHILEKAELMALFSEMDPDPQIRIDNTGKIIQTNDAARRVFTNINSNGKNIIDIIPSLNTVGEMTEKNFIDVIDEKIFSVSIKPGRNFDFNNIYLHDITKQKNYEASLEEYKNKLKDLADKLDTSIEEVKKTVSFELHDDIGQRLLALRMKASHGNLDGPEFSSEIETVYQRVRELSRELRPSELSNLGLRVSIQNLVETISKSSGIKGSFEFYGKDDKTDDNIATCIYRVIQESMNNILKHSKATEFSVSLHFKEEVINLLVIDNGIGIPEKYFSSSDYKHFGIGLFNMKERVEKYNGSFKINSDHEIGTSLIIQIPYKRK